MKIPNRKDKIIHQSPQIFVTLCHDQSALQEYEASNNLGRNDFLIWPVLGCVQAIRTENTGKQEHFENCSQMEQTVDEGNMLCERK